MDPLINCVLAVCCPPLSQGQHDALVTFLVEHGVDADRDAVQSCVAILLKHFDLAPAGTLQPFKDAIAQLARGADYKG